MASTWDSLIIIATLSKKLVSFMNGFHVSVKLPKTITSSFLTLIPKTENPQEISEF